MVCELGRRSISAFPAFAVVAFALVTSALVTFALGVASGALAQQEAENRVQQLDARAGQIAQIGLWGEEAGTWRTKTQLFFDPISRQLARRTVTVWDPTPSRNLDFTWVPARRAVVDGGRVSGPGQLTWRTRDKPSYDPRSVVSIYRGHMQDGRPHGHGEYKDITGIAYQGEWVDGHPRGLGHLRLPNGDDYVGMFLDGRPNGYGRYIDVAGEIYRGPFINGRREGRASTTLPNGSVYQSEWRDGVEVPNSRYVRLAQSPGRPPAGGAPSADDVRLGVFVNPLDLKIFRPRADLDEQFLKNALGYIGENNEQGLRIRPDNKRLIAMWKGDMEIQLTSDEEFPVWEVLPEVSYGVFSYARTLLPPVGITLEVQNRATAAVQVTGAYLEVVKSTTDRQPALQVSVGSGSGCGGAGIRDHAVYSPKLSLENFGWGRAQNAKITYDFVTPGDKSAAASPARSKSLGTIDKTLAVNFEQDLAAAGVDVRLLARQATRNGFKCSSPKDLKACLKEIGGERIFGTLVDKIAFPPRDAVDASVDNSPPSDPADDVVESELVTMVAGSIEYDWTDAAGGVNRRVSPFRANLWLGKLETSSECGDGSSIARIRSNPVELRLDQARYRVAVPFRQAVPAGRVVRYALDLVAARASEHDFVVVLQTADGREIRSRPVNLLYFVPSWFVRRQGS